MLDFLLIRALTSMLDKRESRAVEEPKAPPIRKAKERNFCDFELFPYCNHTVLTYSELKGNEIRFLDGSGACYLWNSQTDHILKGEWRVDNSKVYFQFDEERNPVVKLVPYGFWDGQIFEDFQNTISDTRNSDIYQLKEHSRLVPLVTNPRIPAFEI